MCTGLQLLAIGTYLAPAGIVIGMRSRPKRDEDLFAVSGERLALVMSHGVGV